MRNRIIFILLWVFGISISQIKTATSRFVSSVEIQNSYQTELYLNFYKNPEENAVGFRTFPTDDYDKLIYSISYDHDGGLTEVIPGIIDNSSANPEILREWFTLGTCSEGGTCVHHDVESDIKLDIEYYNGASLEKSLQRRIAI